MTNTQFFALMGAAFLSPHVSKIIGLSWAVFFYIGALAFFIFGGGK
jgi:hypothetical protein